MKRKTILVLAYSISPVRGSEYSVGWNYVKEMSLTNDLIVLYGLAGDHMGDVSEVEDSVLCQNMPNVQFIAVRPSLITNFLNRLNRKGILVYTFYFAYKKMTAGLVQMLFCSTARMLTKAVWWRLALS